MSPQNDFFELIRVTAQFVADTLTAEPTTKPNPKRTDSLPITLQEISSEMEREQRISTRDAKDMADKALELRLATMAEGIRDIRGVATRVAQIETKRAEGELSATRLAETKES